MINGALIPYEFPLSNCSGKKKLIPLYDCWHKTNIEALAFGCGAPRRFQEFSNPFVSCSRKVTDAQQQWMVSVMSCGAFRPFFINSPN